MTVTSRFFADGSYYSQPDFAKLMRDSLSTGVITGVEGELAVSAFTGYMGVIVAKGRAYIEGFSVDVEDSTESLEISAADTTNPRIDRVILRLSRTTNKNITLTVLKGTAATPAVAPTLTQTSDDVYEISLAQVYIPPGITSITSAYITDERTYSSPRSVPLAKTTSAGIMQVGSGLEVTAAGVVSVTASKPMYTIRVYQNAATSGTGAVEIYASSDAIDVSTQASRLAIVQEFARHCLLKQNFIDKVYVNEENFEEDVDGNAVVLTGADGDFMLEIDTIYWTCESHANYFDIKFSTYKFDPLAQTAHIFDGTTRKHIYIGVFNGWDDSTYLRSISTTNVPSNAQNIDWFYTEAQKGGAGMGTGDNTYGIVNFPQWTLLQLLHLFVYATKNIQDIARGLNSGSGSAASALLAVNSGFSPTGGWTQGSTANYTTCCMTLGIMNFYGKQWQFVGETIFNGGSWKYATDANDHYAVATGTYAGAPETWATVAASTPTSLSQSYITKLLGVSEAPFVPIAASSGSSSTYYCDAAWSATGDRCVISGATVNAAAGLAGVFSVAVHSAVSASSWSSGARLRAHSQN